jgi:hypothetical protein
MPTQKPGKKILPLPQTWSDQEAERHYQILERTQDVVLVEVRNQARINIGYEVAEIQVVPFGIRNDAHSQLREAYPPPQSFGRLAWSYGPNQLAAARERIARIWGTRTLPKPEDLPAQIQTKTNQTRLRLLPKMVRTNGRTMHQIWREGAVAIYCDANPPRSNAVFEVILIRQTKPHPRDPLVDRYDLVELYPSSEDFGESAWTFTEAFPHSLGCEHTKPAERKDPWGGALCKASLLRARARSQS